MAAAPASSVQGPLAFLFAGAVDYAGLFPPAGLAMPAAVREYGEQRWGQDAWALGRFVVGVEALDSLVAARRDSTADVWPLSLLAASGDAPAISRFVGSQSSFTVEAIETKGASRDAIAALAPLTRLAAEVYVELPATADLADLLPAVGSLGARAKLRTGGVTADAFPPSEQVARFMTACARANIPFKATAGLHHLVRGEYALTYAAGSPQGTMFGFLNIFVASALARLGAPTRIIEEVLDERAARAFDLRDDGLTWREVHLTSDDLRAARALISSFGSCSFREPMAELHTAFARI